MTYDCSCDYGDPPAFYNATQPRSKKCYVCDECGGPIIPGEHYERVSAKWDYGVDTIRTCERCFDLRIWVKNSVPCLCIMHGNMDEEMTEAVKNAYERAREEVTGLWVGFQRRMIARDKLNRERRSAITDRPSK